MKKVAILGAGFGLGHFAGEYLGASLGLTATSGFDAVDVLQIILAIVATLILFAYIG